MIFQSTRASRMSKGLKKVATKSQILVIRIVLAAAVAAQTPAGYEPGRRVLLDAHNAYPYEGRWSDRIDRALATGLPLAIEQDLVWRPATATRPLSRSCRTASRSSAKNRRCVISSNASARSQPRHWRPHLANVGRSSRSTSISRTAIRSILPKSGICSGSMRNG